MLAELSLSNQRRFCSNVIGVPSALIVTGVFSSFYVMRFRLNRTVLLSTAILIIVSINVRGKYYLT